MAWHGMASKQLTSGMVKTLPAISLHVPCDNVRQRAVHGRQHCACTQLRTLRRRHSGAPAMRPCWRRRPPRHCWHLRGGRGVLRPHRDASMHSTTDIAVLRTCFAGPQAWESPGCSRETEMSAWICPRTGRIPHSPPAHTTYHNGAHYVCSAYGPARRCSPAHGQGRHVPAPRSLHGCAC